MTDAFTLIGARRAFVIAPAGCGKTHLIAEAVSFDSEHRSLVLTHTHAGVDALRRHLRTLGAKSAKYEIDTIAGWCLRLTVSFPGISHITTQRPVNEQWPDIYRATANVLSLHAIKQVMRASFNAVYVDEYQDCSPLQHDVILKLADILPTRILGDPLQGIFDFGGAGIVDWQTHVRPHFDELPSLFKPYRWAGKNPMLGEWLLVTVRKELETGHPVDLRRAPNKCVTFVQLPSDKKKHGDMQREICIAARFPANETSLAIHNWEPQCHNLARQTGGKFKSMETIECENLFLAAKNFDQATDALSLAEAVFNFGCLCLSKVKVAIESHAAHIFDGSGLQKRQYKYQDQLNALTEIATTGSRFAIRKVLLTLACTTGAKKARHELFSEMLNALKEYETGRHSSIEEAAILARDKTRRLGRMPGRYVISRTLLVKGLEFDHVTILNGNALDKKNLYVALTRASRSLTILGTSPVLDPK